MIILIRFINIIFQRCNYILNPFETKCGDWLASSFWSNGPRSCQGRSTSFVSITVERVTSTCILNSGINLPFTFRCLVFEMPIIIVLAVCRAYERYWKRAILSVFICTYIHWCIQTDIQTYIRMYILAWIWCTLYRDTVWNYSS